MTSPVRILVWAAVVLASVGVGYYISHAPAPVGGAESAKAPGKYVFIAGGADPYWQLCIAGAEETAEQLGADLKVMKPKGEGEEGLKEQLDWLTALDPEAIGGVAIGPIDPERETTLINKLSENVKVVTVDSDAPESRRLCYIGSSNYEAGMLAAQMVKEAAPDGGKVVMLLASLAKTNAAERKRGFDDELSGVAEDDEEPAADAPRYEVVEYLMDYGDYDRCVENVKQAISEHNDLSAVVATFGYHAPAALEALADLDVKPPVIAFDEHEKTLAGVEDGSVHATIVQDPYMFGAEAISLLDQVHSGKFLSLPVGAKVDVGVHCRIVKKDNLEEFKTGLPKQD
ncbi:MAG: substrate-binding domain-containing protein [Planctomycetales bacterium]|nr:substrate-binding domain-containing protein [Planctomycetales bacterium]